MKDKWAKGSWRDTLGVEPDSAEDLTAWLTQRMRENMQGSFFNDSNIVDMNAWRIENKPEKSKG